MDYRKDDAASRTWFRSDRFFSQGPNWYFSTRENTVEGPYDSRLEALTGKPLPASAKMPTTYSGMDRLFVMSPRGSVLKTERYNITAMAFTKAPLGSVELYTKAMGEVAWAAPKVLTQVPGRSVWEISLPPSVS